MHLPKTDRPGYHLIFPNIFGFKGGIQVYSAFLLEALQKLTPHARYDVFLKYDKPDCINSPFLPHTQFHCFGQFPRWLQSLFFALKILVLGIWQRPNLVVSTHINYGIACYVLQRLTGIPYWIVAHGTEVWNLQHPLHRLALRHADRILAVSHHTRNRLLAEQPLNPVRISVLPNTFDGDRFQIAPKPPHLLERYGLQPNQPVLLSVSRLGKSDTRDKGLDRLLHTVAKVRDRLPNLHYLVVGKGDDRPRLKSLATQLGIADCVTFAGFIPDEELNQYYNLCDLFALPSCIEGFGIVYLEALASGKPVLAGNGDGAIDPLQGGELGCLVNPFDLDAIADSIFQILEGTHPNTTLYQPEILRQKTLARFEFCRFQDSLKILLSRHLVKRAAWATDDRNHLESITDEYRSSKI